MDATSTPSLAPLSFRNARNGRTVVEKDVLLLWRCTVRREL